MTLKSKVVAGLGWTTGAKLLGQVVTWVVTILVMRLLSPADYGLLAMASIFVAFLSMMAAAGLGPAIVQATTINESNLRQLLGLIIVLNAALFGLLFLVAPLIATFFDEPRLTAVIRVLSTQFIISGLAVIPESMLERELKFKTWALIDLSSNVVGGITTLILALYGYGVWALVAGTMFTASGKCIGVNVAAPSMRWPSLSMRGIRPLLAFGGNVTAGRILWFFYSQADIFIAGKLLGKEALGFYSVAMHLASLPVQRISGILNKVAFPAFAQLQREPEMVRAHVLKAVRMLCFFAFPVLWGISSIAPELVRLVLGPKWEAAILPLQILPLIMPLRMVGNFLPSATDAVGRPDVSVKNLMVASIVMPLAFLTGGQWGVPGLCIAWAAAFPLVFLANMTRALPIINIRVAQFIAVMAWPALASGVMYAAVIGTGFLISNDVGGLLRTVILVFVGAGVYGALALGTNRAGCEEVLQVVRR